MTYTVLSHDLHDVETVKFVVLEVPDWFNHIFLGAKPKEVAYYLKVNRSYLVSDLCKVIFKEDGSSVKLGTDLYTKIMDSFNKAIYIDKAYKIKDNG